jgi:hypothetical protein
MIITADLIEAYLKCPTKCFLLSRDEVETGNAYAEWTTWIAVTTGLRNVATAVMSSAKFSGEESKRFLLRNARH